MLFIYNILRDFFTHFHYHSCSPSGHAIGVFGVHIPEMVYFCRAFNKHAFSEAAQNGIAFYGGRILPYAFVAQYFWVNILRHFSFTIPENINAPLQEFLFPAERICG